MRSDLQAAVLADTAAAEQMLGGIIERLERPGLGLQMLGRMLEDYERDIFDSSDHGQWPVDEPATRRLKHSGRTLIDTGRLMANLTHAHIEGDTVQVDAGDASYAKYVARRRDPAPTPDRPTVDKWAQALGLYLADGVSI